jgi:hypothetical protein
MAEKFLTVGALIKKLRFLIKTNQCTKDTMVLLSSDVEGNSYGIPYSEDNISFDDEKIYVEDGKKKFKNVVVIFPSSDSIEAEFDYEKAKKSAEEFCKKY